MHDKKQIKDTQTNQKRPAIISLVAVLIIVGSLFGVATLRKPDRSVASYCKVYRSENTKLPHEGGDKYSAGIFTSSKNDPHKFEEAYGSLERVSPSEIQTDVKILQSVFKKIDDDPSQTFSASLSGLSAQENIKTWTKKNCVED